MSKNSQTLITQPKLHQKTSEQKTRFLKQSRFGHKDFFVSSSFR